jgi:hypothetical protein
MAPIFGEETMGRETLTAEKKRNRQRLTFPFRNQDLYEAILGKRLMVSILLKKWFPQNPLIIHKAMYESPLKIILFGLIGGDSGSWERCG